MKNDLQLAEALLKPLFEESLVREMLQFGEIKHFSEGEVIMDYGKYVRSMPLILKGTIKVFREEDDKEILLYYLSDQETCSMAYSCCMEARKSEVKAIADEDVFLVSIPHQKLDEWLCSYPSWKNYIMRSFNLRFIELLKSLEQIAFHRLDERLENYLREKSARSGSALIHLSHQQIADEMGSSRVVISRLLKHLENEKRLLIYRNEIKLLPNF